MAIKPKPRRLTSHTGPKHLAHKNLGYFAEVTPRKHPTFPIKKLLRYLLYRFCPGGTSLVRKDERDSYEWIKGKPLLGHFQWKPTGFSKRQIQNPGAHTSSEEKVKKTFVWLQSSRDAAEENLQEA